MAVIPSSDGDFRSVMASVDKSGQRRVMHVQLHDGFWRRCRIALAVLLIGFYLALPFLTIDGLPFLRIDIPQRRYIIAGQVFWPQDSYYLLLFLLIAMATTLLTVAVAGRVFCGWFCPHSVFLEMIYRPLERLTRGTPARQAADEAAGTAGPRRLVAWLLYALVSGALANTATALFIGTDGFLGGVLVDPTAHPAAALFFTVFFLLILVNFGWLREQTCTIVCPYGRLQSVMLDPHSLVVAYDARRGEPRGKPGETSGDCIACQRCVAVCPTGIDIRNGSQMECIHCAACVDACDSVMQRLERAPGLIRYASEIGLAGGKRRILRVRTVIYALAVVGLTGFAVFRLGGREPLVASRLRTSAAPALVELDGRTVVRQILPLALVNRSGQALACTLTLPSDLGATIILPNPSLVLPPNQRVEIVPVVDLARERFADHDLATVLSIATASGSRVDLPITLHAP